MKYSSKQKLAMAMAAGMVVSMAPAMAFAAEVDFVNTATELGKEPAADRADLTKINTVAAKDVLTKAKAVVNGDANAQALVDAYEASIEVYEAFVAKDKTAFKNAVDKFNMNSAKVKAYLKDPAHYTNGLGHAQSRFAAWDSALNPSVVGEDLAGLNYEIGDIAGLKVIYVNLPSEIDKATVTAADVTVKGADGELALGAVKADKNLPRLAVVLSKQDDIVKVVGLTLKSGGKTYRVLAK
ncbi:MAG: hypothetical protein Q4A78_09045 [Peptostreptococcaceae bacterium]|nr:hypothetical protein [Peptostreptococcaceae bacterium]